MEDLEIPRLLCKKRYCQSTRNFLGVRSHSASLRLTCRHILRCLKRWKVRSVWGTSLTTPIPCLVGKYYVWHEFVLQKMYYLSSIPNSTTAFILEGFYHTTSYTATIKWQYGYQWSPNWRKVGGNIRIGFSGRFCSQPNMIWSLLGVLGDNRTFLWIVSCIGHCTSGASYTRSSKSLFGWLHCGFWSVVSLRSDWASLRVLRLLFLERRCEKRPVHLIRGETGRD